MEPTKYPTADTSIALVNNSLSSENSIFKDTVPGIKSTSLSPTNVSQNQSSYSPCNQWVKNTRDAIELLENQIDSANNQSSSLLCTTASNDFNVNESLSPANHLSHGSPAGVSFNCHRPKSEGEIATKEKCSELEDSQRPQPLQIQSNATVLTRQPSYVPNNKPSSILKHPSSKHKRCASLGQTIRYIDETTPFTPITCPSTPNALDANSPSSHLSCCAQCNCSTTRSPTTQQLCLSEDEEGQPWLTQTTPLPSDPSHSGCCHCCVSCYMHRTPNSVSMDSNLIPAPLASHDRLSALDDCVNFNDRPFYHCAAATGIPNSDYADRQSLYSVNMEKDFRYYFQHPYTRLFIAYFVTFCNFLIFAEDPISHSPTECEIPVVGNVISFVFTRYPPEWHWQAVKVSLWVIAMFIGLLVGKYVVHHILLRRVLRLKMFRDEEGTWMIMIISMFLSCYVFSVVYNYLLISAHPMASRYVINTRMGVSNANFMKAAACGTWLGDFFTAWMVTDMMLQDNLYPCWATGLRRFWRNHGYVRIVVFWSGSVGITTLVVYLIVSDDISWDNLNQDFIASTELSRAFLASSILVMDLLIVMQDWDFPHFVCDLDIKLPGVTQASYTLEFFKKSVNSSSEIYFHITGKWFNYGIIVIVMMLDLNMWKNQIIYYPPGYGQYTGPDHKVYTVDDKNLLATGNQTLWTYAVRASAFDPSTNRTYIEGDLKVNSRYLGYPAYVKSMAFLPCAAGFILFFTLIYQYGRFPPKTDASAGGRLKKRNPRNSSWRRERRDSRLGGYISWRGITEYRLGVRDFTQRRTQHVPCARVNSAV